MKGPGRRGGGLCPPARATPEQRKAEPRREQALKDLPTRAKSPRHVLKGNSVKKSKTEEVKQLCEGPPRIWSNVESGLDAPVLWVEKITHCCEKT